MITRIVKMTFHPEKVDEFIEIFREAKPKIESCDGCTQVQLMRDTEQSNICFTLSFWQTMDQLNNYRKSDLFSTTWERAKQLFSDRPEAWSIEQLL